MSAGYAPQQDWDSFHTPHDWRVTFSDSDPDRRKRDPLLDTPSEPHPLLNIIMDRTLIKLSMIANGATQAWGPDAGMRPGSKGESREPTATDVWTVDQLAWDFQYGASTHRGRLRIILQAQTMLKRAKADSALIRGTAAWKARIAEDPRSARACAADYGVSHTTIAAVRREMQARDPESPAKPKTVWGIEAGRVVHHPGSGL